MFSIYCSTIPFLERPSIEYPLPNIEFAANLNEVIHSILPLYEIAISDVPPPISMFTMLFTALLSL